MNGLSLQNTARLVCVLALMFACSDVSARGEKKSDTRSDCDHILPLMMMLGSAPTVHLSSMWLLGLISLGTTIFLGKWSLS